MRDDLCGRTRAVALVHLDLATKDNRETPAHLADLGQRFTRRKCAYIAEPAKPLDLRRLQRRKHLVAPRVYDGRRSCSHTCSPAWQDLARLISELTFCPPRTGTTCAARPRRSRPPTGSPSQHRLARRTARGSLAAWPRVSCCRRVAQPACRLAPRARHRCRECAAGARCVPQSARSCHRSSEPAPQLHPWWRRSDQL